MIISFLSEMRRFAKGILLYTVFFLTVSFSGNLILKRIVNRYAHNEVYSLKHAYFSKNAFKYNTVFFGSSFTYRQINPRIIDRESGKFNIRSFNFGSPAMSNPEALYLFEDFIGKLTSGSTIKFAFLELTDLAPINKANQYSPRSYHYLNLKYLSFVLKYFFSNNGIDLISKIKLSYPFFKGYLLNNFLLSKPSRAPAIGRKYLGKSKDGYYALDVDLKENGAKELSARHLAFLKDTSVLTKMKPIRKIPGGSSSGNLVYLEFLKELILRAESKKVKLYFVIPPRLVNYAMLYFYKERMYDDRVIDLSGNPEFYSAELSFDKNHLNSSGAAVFSACLADEIKIKLCRQAH